MPKSREATIDLVDMLVRSLVDDQESVSVVATTNDEEGIIIEIKVNPEETGKIIGRQGRIIKSIRTLSRAQSDFSIEIEVIG